MVDCQSNTRHLLSWLMDRLDNERATIFLSVGKAVDQGTGLVSGPAPPPACACADTGCSWDAGWVGALLRTFSEQASHRCRTPTGALRVLHR